MDNGWIPTAYLRFVERMEIVDPGPPSTGRRVRILQQKWEQTMIATDDVWRDVPLAVDDTEVKP